MILEANELPCLGCNAETDAAPRFAIPPRSASGAPLYFTVMVMVRDLPGLAPTDGARPAAPPFEDRPLGTGRYELPTEFETCSATVSAPQNPQHPLRERCTQFTNYKHANRITGVFLGISGDTIVQLAASPTATYANPPSIGTLTKRPQGEWKLGDFNP
ncbi:MAG: hypothetical protein WKG01_05530 [Kofleriaceae bacterium]